QVVVHETGEMNRLKLENRSKEEVFVQAGDIVTGGRQDRAIGQDVVLAPRSGKVAVIAWCVEFGRWSARGQEDDARFRSSPSQLASREVKLAARYAGLQGGGAQGGFQGGGFQGGGIQGSGFRGGGFRGAARGRPAGFQGFQGGGALQGLGGLGGFQGAVWN